MLQGSTTQARGPKAKGPALAGPFKIAFLNSLVGPLQLDLTAEHRLSRARNGLVGTNVGLDLEVADALPDHGRLRLPLFSDRIRIRPLELPGGVPSRVEDMFE